VAQYILDIAALADGTGVPTGFTQRWDAGSQTITVAANTIGPQSKSLSLVTSALVRAFLGWDVANADSDRGNCDVLCLIQQDGLNSSSIATTFGGLACRGTGAGGGSSETGTVVALRASTGNSASTTRVRRLVYTSGSASGADSSEAPTWVSTERLWLRLVVNGSTGNAYLYPLNDPLGTPIGSITFTPGSSNADNWIGLFSNASLTDSTYYWLSLGTGSDNAQLPTAPSLTTPTGVETGATTATGTVDTSVNHGTLYCAVTTSATPPSGAAIIAGTGFAFAGNQAITTTGTKTFNATGLTPETTYYFHYIHDTGYGVLSSISSSASFTTDSPVTAVKGARIRLYDGATAQASITGITAQWWDTPTPSGAPVTETATASTDGSGWLQIDIDTDTSLDIDDLGHLRVFKLDGDDPLDSLGWQGVLPVIDIAN
jgi:hypothetical protein